MQEKKVDFSLSLLFFWVKGHVSVDASFIKMSIANTIFGLIPAGKNEQSIPLKNVSAVTLSKKYVILPMIVGLLISLTALGMFSESVIGGLIVLAIGLLMLGSGIKTRLTIQRAGRDFDVDVPFYEKGKLNSLKNEIDDALARNDDKTNLELFMDRKEI